MPDGDDANWIDLTDELPPGEGERLVALLAEQEIEARLEEGRLQVPESLEGDATAVLAGADQPLDAAPEVDRARELARLTEPVTPDPLSPMQAWDIVNRLHAAAIEATTDMPTSTFTAMDVSAGCRVLVAPGDLPRARDVIANAERAATAAPEWLVKKAKAVVADGLTEAQANDLRRALGMHGLASIVKEEHGAFAVRVRPGDDSLAQDVLQRLALGVRADAQAAADAAEAAAAAAAAPTGPAAGLAGADEPEGSQSITANVITLAALAILAWMVMKACNG